MARLVVILALTLIVFRPQDLPRLALTLSRTSGDLRRAAEELIDAFRLELEAMEREQATHPPNA